MTGATGMLASLAAGLAFGAAYALIGVRSPAPPLVALIGLLGMVTGEQAVTAWRHREAPPEMLGSVQSPAASTVGNGASVGAMSAKSDPDAVTRSEF